jgi:transcriptional regulator with XRE-family HTH domain
MDTDPPEMIDQHVAIRIRSRRTEMGITLQSLAGQIGVAFQQAHKYERGLSRISAGRLYHVARALKVPVGFFFAGDEGAGALGSAASRYAGEPPAGGPTGAIGPSRDEEPVLAAEIEK